MAATTGHADLVGYLVAHGAPAPGLDPAGAFVAAALAADRASLDRLLAIIPGWPARCRSSRPALITWAAACGRPEAVEILAGLGFDVNAMGRTDVPSDQPWQTALHKAAEDGHLELARTLLRLGADPDIRDHRFGSTPLGWARYFGQPPLIDLLDPLTAPDPQADHRRDVSVPATPPDRSKVTGDYRGMIARIWRGAVRAEDAAAYAAYVQETGIEGYQRTPGNRGAWALWRVDGDRAEIVTVSLWESRSAIEAFAGQDIEQAVFYPEDDRYLIDRDLTVRHYEVACACCLRNTA